MTAVSTFLSGNGWLIAPDIEGMRACILLDNGTPFWSVVNFVNLASLHFENEKKGDLNNKVKARKCGLLLNMRRCAMANSCSAIHFCAMFGHELTEQQFGGAGPGSELISR